MSDPMPTQPGEFPGASRRRGVRWDPTVNLGHILTAGAMLIAGFTAWGSLDKRVTTLETSATLAERHQRERDAQQDQLIRDSVQDIKQTTREIKQTVEDLRRGGNGR